MRFFLVKFFFIQIRERMHVHKKEPAFSQFSPDGGKSFNIHEQPSRLDLYIPDQMSRTLGSPPSSAESSKRLITRETIILLCLSRTVSVLQRIGLFMKTRELWRFYSSANVGDNENGCCAVIRLFVFEIKYTFCYFLNVCKLKEKNELEYNFMYD